MKPARLGHRPVLDGLRGIAIVMVVGVNSGWPGFGGGFLGVDLFFVLSGFLITSLLLEEAEGTGRILLGRFFLRRVVRLMPALALLLLVSLVYAVVLRSGDQRYDALLLVLSAFLYCSNWVIALGGIHGTLEHTWSLGVEAQFYLLWGCFLWWSVRRGATVKQWLRLTLVLMACSALWRSWLWASEREMYRVYMGLDTRLDTILTGCLVALAMRLPGMGSMLGSAFVRNVLALACLLTLGGAVACSRYKGEMTYTLVLPLVAAVSGVLVFLAVSGHRTWVIRWLECAPLVWLGTISYSLYLWHVPLGNVLSRDRLHGLGLTYGLAEALRLLAFLIVAAASFYFVERRFLPLRLRLGASSTSLGK